MVNPEGYVGTSVSVDIGYAYARNKPIIAMCPPTDTSLRELVRDVLPPKALIKSIRSKEI